MSGMTRGEFIALLAGVVTAPYKSLFADEKKPLPTSEYGFYSPPGTTAIEPDLPNGVVFMHAFPTSDPSMRMYNMHLRKSNGDGRNITLKMDKVKLSDLQRGIGFIEDRRSWSKIGKDNYIKMIGSAYDEGRSTPVYGDTPLNIMKG